MNASTVSAKPGRKPSIKSWDTRLSHNLRTSYSIDATTHILLFLAGNHATELINAALRTFAISHNIPVEDHEFQRSFFMCASNLQATNKLPPLPNEVIEGLGQTSILDKLNCALGIAGALAAPSPRLPASPPVTPAFAPRPVPATSSAQVPPKPAPALPSAPAHAPVASSAPQLQVQSSVASAAAPRKPPPNIDMGPDIDLAPPPAEEATGNSLKNRWLATHDY